jgi:hypothetical protein
MPTHEPIQTLYILSSTLILQSTPFLTMPILVKKHHFLESLSHSLIAQNICKVFFVNVTIMREF